MIHTLNGIGVHIVTLADALRYCHENKKQFEIGRAHV